jgi:RND family efflux transporter MFP subunit
MGLPALLAASLLVAAAAPAPARSAPGEEAGWLGVLFAEEGVDVSAEVSGVVREVLVGLGDRVDAGQVLVSLASGEARSGAEQARAALETARARTAQARAALDDVDRILERRRAAEEVFSREEIQAIETRRAVAQAELEAAESVVAEREAGVRELDRRLGALEVRAPYAGAVTACLLDAGARVAAGQGVVRLISADDLWVRFAVPSAESRWLAPGRRIRVVPGGQEDAARAGEVRRVAPEIDPATDMVFAEARVESAAAAAPRLLAGETVRVHPDGAAAAGDAP